MASPLILSQLFSLLCLLLTLASSSSTNTKPTIATATTTATITLSLTPFTETPYTSPWQRLNHLATSSITRAHHLKQPHKKKTSFFTEIPLFPHGYGAYSVSLAFGTPPQTLPLIMDTGSSLVWFPCTRRYFCSKCDFPSANPSNVSTFIPKSSSSARVLGCSNPPCGLFYGPGVGSQCQGCDGGSVNCTDQICPPYAIQYVSGSTIGLLMSETLKFPRKSVRDFVVGCSVFSTRQPSGIAGFGRGPESLPTQMGLKKFSYCLVSHRYDDTPRRSDLFLVDRSDSGDGETKGVSYTPFLKIELSSNSAFRDYYYVHVRKITVGGKHVKVPYRFLVPGSDGHGGTIVDSGTTFTFMEREVHEGVAQVFEKQMAHFRRDADVEKKYGLRPCFDISSNKSVSFPELIFHFKGGAEMALPAADYFSFVGGKDVVCLTIVTDSAVRPEVAVGPSIIIGNYQQQNFYLEYDLENDKFGFRKQIC